MPNADNPDDTEPSVDVLTRMSRHGLKPATVTSGPSAAASLSLPLKGNELLRTHFPGKYFSLASFKLVV